MITTDLKTEVEVAYKKRYDGKLSKLLKKAVAEKELVILPTLRKIIEIEKKNGFILSEAVKAYFRLKRSSINDCSPLFEFFENEDYTINESLLEVLGYDKVVPDPEIQKEIITKFEKFGRWQNQTVYTDPRYGLAAACAGWEEGIVTNFLKQCLEVDDAPLKYVATNSLKRKYVKLR